MGVRNPERRSFIMLLREGEPSATAMRAGADGVEGFKPDWLAARAREEGERTKLAISVV